MEKSLFDTFQIGNTTLNNRFVRSATWEGMCGQSGAVTPKLTEYCKALARGGVGLIISGYSYVREDGRQYPGTMGIYNDDLLPGLKQLTEAVHQEGGVIFCQLVHVGGQASSKVIGETPLAPSAIESFGNKELPREMTTKDISAIVACFGEAARRAKKAGFDGVQLHGAHGYLINQFLSPLCNQREDDYGGDASRRMRFLEEVYTTVRSAVGSDYPVSIKLTASDNIQGGFNLNEAVAVAQRLEVLGIDAIEVSSGTPTSGEMNPVRQKIDSPDQEAYNAEFASAIKHAVEIPVILVGGLRSCGVMQELLWRGDADLFALSRPLIREPKLPNLWQEDDNHISTCISCNGCFRPGLKEGGIYCVIDKIEEKNQNPQI